MARLLTDMTADDFAHWPDCLVVILQHDPHIHSSSSGTENEKAGRLVLLLVASSERGKRMIGYVTKYGNGRCHIVLEGMWTTMRCLPSCK